MPISRVRPLVFTSWRPLTLAFLRVRSGLKTPSTSSQAVTNMEELKENKNSLKFNFGDFCSLFYINSSLGSCCLFFSWKNGPIKCTQHSASEFLFRLNGAPGGSTSFLRPPQLLSIGFFFFAVRPRQLSNTKVKGNSSPWSSNLSPFIMSSKGKNSCPSRMCYKQRAYSRSKPYSLGKNVPKSFSPYTAFCDVTRVHAWHKMHFGQII